MGGAQKKWQKPSKFSTLEKICGVAMSEKFYFLVPIAFTDSKLSIEICCNILLTNLYLYPWLWYRIYILALGKPAKWTFFISVILCIVHEFTPRLWHNIIIRLFKSGNLNINHHFLFKGVTEAVKYSSLVINLLIRKHRPLAYPILR